MAKIQNTDYKDVEQQKLFIAGRNAKEDSHFEESLTVFLQS